MVVRDRLMASPREQKHMQGLWRGQPGVTRTAYAQLRAEA